MGGLHRLRVLRLSPRGRTWLLRGLSAVGFVFLAKTLLAQGIEGAGGLGGLDAIAYWTAASNVRDGAALYATPVGSFTAYPYPPVLAQLLVPFSYLPMPAFVWLWRLVEIGALRVAVGTWTWTGMAMLLPPVVAEIDAGNVHLIMAAVCALAMRGIAGGVVPAALLKFASLPLAPLGWRLDRRGLVAGGIVAAGVIAFSFAVAPTAWSDYARYLGTNTFPSGWYNVAAIVPLPLRLGLAGVAAIAAMRWIRLAPVAVVLAYPVLWFHSLSTLVAIVAPLKPVEATAPRRASERGLAEGRSAA